MLARSGKDGDHRTGYVRLSSLGIARLLPRLEKLPPAPNFALRFAFRVAFGVVCHGRSLWRTGRAKNQLRHPHQKAVAADKADGGDGPEKTDDDGEHNEFCALTRRYRRFAALTRLARHLEHRNTHMESELVQNL